MRCQVGASTYGSVDLQVMWVTSQSVQSPTVQFGLTTTSLKSVAAYKTSTYTTPDYTSGLLLSTCYSLKATSTMQLSLAWNQTNSTTTGGRESFPVTHSSRIGDAGGDWNDWNTFNTNRNYPITFLATGDVGTIPYCEGCQLTIPGMISYTEKVCGEQLQYG